MIVSRHPKCQHVPGLSNPLPDLARSSRELVIPGRFTSLAPEVFAGRGVALLSTVWVLDADQTLRVVIEGGGSRQFAKAAGKLTVRMNK